MTHILKYFLKQENRQQAKLVSVRHTNTSYLSAKKKTIRTRIQTKNILKGKKKRLEYLFPHKKNHFQFCCLTKKLHLISQSHKLSHTPLLASTGPVSEYTFIILLNFRLHKISSKLNQTECCSIQKVRIVPSFSSNFTSRQQKKLSRYLFSTSVVQNSYGMSRYQNYFSICNKLLQNLVSLIQGARRIHLPFLNIFRMPSYFFCSHLLSSSNRNPSYLNTSLLGYYWF